MKAKLICVYLLVGILLIGCMASVKPIYNDKEQAKAEKAVERFHQLLNEKRFDEMYELFDSEARAGTPLTEFTSVANQVYEKWGKVESGTLSEAKVFPGTPIQVRMIYNVKFEKGEGQDWFIWNIRGNEARLVQYQNAPGTDKPKSKK